MKRRTFEALEGRSGRNRIGQVVDGFITLLIVLNLAALVLGTVDQISDKAPYGFRLFEAVSVIIFTVEYAARVWSCTSDPRYSGPVRGRLRFMRSPLAVMDAAAIFPFYVIAIAGMGSLDLRGLRALRLVARAARLSRHSRGLHILFAAVGSRRQELLTTAGLLIVLLLLASSLMFFAENKAQPEKFSSIPATMWWSVITLTTVGYGDVAPVTNVGRIIAGVIAVLGVSLFAIPAGIMASGFLEQMQLQQSPQPRICPHCGKEIRGNGN